jgi:hypothetical protein
MPRREVVISPDIAVNSRIIARFVDGSAIFVTRDIYGYHTKGRPAIDRKTKVEMDEALAIIAEDRSGLPQFVDPDKA